VQVEARLGEVDIPGPLLGAPGIEARVGELLEGREGPEILAVVRKGPDRLRQRFGALDPGAITPAIDATVVEPAVKIPELAGDGVEPVEQRDRVGTARSQAGLLQRRHGRGHDLVHEAAGDHPRVAVDLPFDTPPRATHPLLLSHARHRAQAHIRQQAPPSAISSHLH
jgi:hypothetical protein